MELSPIFVLCHFTAHSICCLPTLQFLPTLLIYISVGLFLIPFPSVLLSYSLLKSSSFFLITCPYHPGVVAHSTHLSTLSLLLPFQIFNSLHYSLLHILVFYMHLVYSNLFPIHIFMIAVLAV